MRRSLALVSLLIIPQLSSVVGAQQSYFRSDSGLTAASAKLPGDFEGAAKEVWRTPLKPGNSSPCVFGDSIYLTTWDEAKEELTAVALDRKTGKVRWSHVAPTKTIEAFHPVGSPASSTAACNDQRVFFFFGSYGLLCYDHDGKLLWEKKMGPFQDEFGASSSPVLVDDLIVLNEDHDVDSFLIAIDQKDGRTVWKTPRVDATRSYSTPVVIDNGTKKEIVVAGGLQLAGYDLQSGKKRWWVNSLSRIIDSTPNVVDGHVFVATWTPGGDETERISMEPFPEALATYDKNKDGGIEKSELPGDSPVVPRFFRIDLNQDKKLDKREWDAHASVFEKAQNVAMSVKPGGEGDVSETAIQWVYRRGLPTVPSSVVYDGVMYMVKDSGIVTLLDAKTGKLIDNGRARGRGNYYASLVAGDGKVYLCSERGVVTVLKAGGKFDVLSSHDFGERIMATPVVSQGRLFLRTDDALYCFAKK